MPYTPTDNAPRRDATSPSRAERNEANGETVKQILDSTGIVTSQSSSSRRRTDISPSKRGRSHVKAVWQAKRRLTEEEEAAERATREAAIEEARFIAGETGTRFVYDPGDPTESDPGGIHVDSAGWIDEKTREAAVTVAKDGSYGRIDFRTAQAESEDYIRRLAHAPDVDPEGEGEDGCSALRLSILQGLARHFLRPERSAPCLPVKRTGGE